MTKEDIIKARIKPLQPTYNLTIADCQQIVFPSMDEYAKQQCILYEQWILKRIFPMMAKGETNQQASEELYQTFLTETSL